MVVFLGVMITAAGMAYAGVPQRLFDEPQESAVGGGSAEQESAAGAGLQQEEVQDSSASGDLQQEAVQDSAISADLPQEASQDSAAEPDLQQEVGQNSTTGTDFLQEDHGGTGLDADALEENNGEKKLVALTFDDGPHAVYTAKLLDGLAERGVKATFFLIGKNIPGNEELVARMAEEGHLIGNHTYDHVKISDLSEEAACEQVEKTCQLVWEITGNVTEFVRPPFGEWKSGLECSFTMIPVLWDVDPLDWTTTNTSLVVQRVLDDVEDGDIILLHDCYDSSVEAAFQIIDALLEKNYEFVTVDKLILE